MKKKVLFSVMVLALIGCGGGGGGSSTTAPGSGGGNGPSIPNPPNPPGSDTDPVAKVRSWSPGFQISNPNREAHNPVATVLASGEVYVSWVEAATEESPSSIFAAVLRADLPEGKRSRDNIQISQLDRGNDQVLANTRWNFLNEVERFRPEPQMAVSQDGVAHVAWLESDGKTTSVYVSDYAPQAGVWSSPLAVESTDEACSEIKLQALSNGDVLLLFKQVGADDTALKAVPFYSNTGKWGAVFEVAASVKGGADVALWEHDGEVLVGYLATLDDKNDRLNVARLDLADLSVAGETVDSTGLKGSVVGAAFQGADVLVWAERDQYGYYSVVGSVNAGDQWQDIPEIEDLPYDAGHIKLAAVENELHIVWRHKDQSSTYLFHDLYSVKYSSSGIGEAQKLFDSGAANPVLVSGGDGKLYVQWFASHTKYSEYTPDRGWSSISQPFCTSGALISGVCYNSGTEHTLDVSGKYGVSAWLQSVNGIRSVAVSLSE